MARPTRIMEQWLRLDTAKGHRDPVSDPVSDPVLVGREGPDGLERQDWSVPHDEVIGSDRAHPVTEWAYLRAS